MPIPPLHAAPKDGPLNSSSPDSVPLPHCSQTAAGATQNTAQRAALLQRLHVLRIASLALLLGLIGLGLGWELLWARTGSGSLALKVLPLVPAVLGVARHRMYTYRWLSLLVWLYVLEGAVRIYSDPYPGNMLALLEILLSLALFVLCVVHIRYRLAQAKSA